MDEVARMDNEKYKRCRALAVRLARFIPREPLSSCYMVNIGHWALGPMWRREKRRLGVPQVYPASDVERLAWELSLMNDEVLAEMGRVLAERERNAEETEKAVDGGDRRQVRAADRRGRHGGRAGRDAGPYARADLPQARTRRTRP